VDGDGGLVVLVGGEGLRFLGGDDGSLGDDFCHDSSDGLDSHGEGGDVDEYDSFGGFAGLLRQFFDFVGHDSKPLAGFTSSSSFDGCVQSQQVCLLGNRVDHFNDVTNLSTAFAQLGHRCVCAIGGFDGMAGNSRRIGCIAGDFPNAGIELINRLGECLSICADLFCCSTGQSRLVSRLLSIRSHLLTHGNQFRPSHMPQSFCRLSQAV
jgi:hypothetical protein